MKHLTNTIREALERAQNGLKWYRNEYPEADSPADDEMNAEIEEALTTLSELEQMAGEPVAWTSQIEIDWAKRNPGRAGSFYAVKEGPSSLPLYTAAPVAQQPQAEAKTVYRLAETDIYDFAGWLTTRPGVMEVGSSKEAGPMAEAVGEYLRAYPERFAPQQTEAVPCAYVSSYELGQFSKVDDFMVATLRKTPGDGRVPVFAAPQQAEAVPPGFVLVPLEPDEMWAYRVIRHHQPNLDVGCKAWLECLKEMLHWHAAIAAAQGEKP